MDMAVARQGWEAELEMVFARLHGATRLSRRRRRGPLALQRSLYPEGEVCHTYLLHPPGGLVGGDSLQIDLTMESAAHALITTPGATKFYRSDGRLARQRQHLRVAAGGCLEWFPQENIFFPGAIAELETCLELTSESRFIGWELHCLGRPAIQEVFTRGQVRARLRVIRDGVPLLIEQLVTEGDSLLRSASGLRHYPMSGSLMLHAPELLDVREAVLEQVRSLLSHDGPQLAAATQLDGLLVIRLLGSSTESMQRQMILIWQALRPLIMQRPACLPRIWST